MTDDAPSSTHVQWLPVSAGKLPVHVAGDGVPLVLIHGWAMDHRIFGPQVTALARAMKVVTYDRRGFGHSEGHADPTSELDDLLTLATNVIGEPFHLLGLSQGGRVALRYAALRPEWVRSLILQGTAVDGTEPQGPEPERIPVEEFARLARAGQLGELRRRWLEHPMMRLDDSHRDARSLLSRMLDDYTGADLIDERRREYQPPGDLLAAIAAKAISVLVLTGARETESRRRIARMLVESLPRARERVLLNSGHLCNLTEPEAYNNAVLEFCRKVDACAVRSDSRDGY